MGHLHPGVCRGRSWRLQLRAEPKEGTIPESLGKSRPGQLCVSFHSGVLYIQKSRDIRDLGVLAYRRMHLLHIERKARCFWV